MENSHHMRALLISTYYIQLLLLGYMYVICVVYMFVHNF